MKTKIRYWVESPFGICVGEEVGMIKLFAMDEGCAIGVGALEIV